MRTNIYLTGTQAQVKEPEEVTNKMYGCNIDIKVNLSGSLICARVGGLSDLGCEHSVSHLKWRES